MTTSYNRTSKILYYRLYFKPKVSPNPLIPT